MVYNCGYCVAIKHKGKTLREFGVNLQNSVVLPFDSEYEILLINNTHSMATAQVIVDGINIFDNKNVILNAHDRTLLKGFYRNDCFNRAFKFVENDDDRVDVKENPNNGIVKVRFKQAYKKLPTFEYSYVNTLWTTHDDSSCNHIHNKPIMFKTDNVSCNSPNIFCCSTLEKGATVGGSHKFQNFNDVSNIFEFGSEVTFTIQLLGKVNDVETCSPLTVKDTKFKYCTICKNKDKFRAIFCSNCGMRYC
ncbi:MAG: hypothetical protein WC934_08455 [Acidithiobacillus sp.]|jgi:hypothetical protein|uniref:hypothetical protein n=1 Tax=Acidithiobacillus sp. TaxID=1872118 RepID=UPI0035610534